MKQRNRSRYLGLTLLGLICCYLAACGVTGSPLGRANRGRSEEGLAIPGPDPTSPPPHEQDLPQEAQTAQTLARATLPPRDLVNLASRLQQDRKLPGAQQIPAAETPAVHYHAPGDRKAFWLHDLNDNAYYTVTARLRYETPHAYWWVAEGLNVPETLLARSARTFEEQTYPHSRRLFGSEPSPGIDGDPHLYLLLAELPGAAGYFSGPDEYPAEVRAHSNEHEMIYLSVGNAWPGDDYFDGVLAHEFQHMIHWALDRNEATWVNEGLSELAAQLNDFDVGGSEQSFVNAPDTQLTTWSDLEDSGPHYGAAYLFLAYFFEQYGPDPLQELVAEPANGIAGFEAVLSHLDPGRTFDELFADWVAANYLDGFGVDEKRYRYTGLDLALPQPSARHNAYPVEQSASVHQYAADYLVLDAQGDLAIRFSGSTTVSLVGNETHSGDYQWCAVRGDEGDARLTQGFDLTGQESATLEFWMWYDLERDYDYAYVEVSNDGGQTWQILPGEGTTTDNPSGNSYGPGWTGTSGRGNEPEWVREVIDLTPFASRPLLLRFEVITDDAINHEGLCLDDITLLPLGFVDDVEEGEGDWQAEGWVRVSDHLTQQFLVQLITFGSRITVETLPLDGQNRGSLTVAGLGHDVDQAVLVVSAISPSTTEPAVYSYRLWQP